MLLKVTADRLEIEGTDKLWLPEDNRCALHSEIDERCPLAFRCWQICSVSPGEVMPSTNRLDDLKRVTCLKDENEIQDSAHNLTVISLKDVNVQIRKVLPLLVCKQLYDDKKIENDSRCYLNLIVDEAHNILSESSERESEQWKDYRLEVFEEIIKEGRKFGTFLTIASQRPSDISPTIISQLHNYFLHRLINNQDIKAVERTVSYLDKVSFESLPILPTGTCVFAGMIANVPVVIDIGSIEKKYEPKNKTMTLIDQWESTDK